MGGQENDRDAGQIAEGVTLIESTLRAHPVGPYQLQAAIAAVHDEAADAGDTDWPQIVSLYRILERIAPSPVVTLNRAVAVGMADGPLARAHYQRAARATASWPERNYLLARLARLG